ncbi:MAG: NAD-dependent epimerase/dehydratase family protein [Lachnospiraceae bacterium]|nr:NAD-dependent epimerase/dehydratase family protein [Lachnospiraceae bacterium]
MRILVTGAAGFIGKNLIETLRREGYDDIISCTLETSDRELEEALKSCDFVFHLAGVNRPKEEREFMEGNGDFTERLVKLAEAGGKLPPILLTSSIQAGLNNPYGESKRVAEEIVFTYGKENQVPVYVYRLPNVFGKWSRPNYNTVVATFCHQIARGLPIRIDNPDSILHLVYIDDVIGQFLRILKTGIRLPAGEFVTFPPRLIYETTVGDLSKLIHSFRESRENLLLPDLGDPFTKKLYSTYLSFLPEDSFSYELETHCDERGSFTEFLKSPDRGQVSVNVSKPGITKGQHWHHTKNEKFLVVSGRACIRFRKIGEEKVIEYHVSGDRPEVVDIPTGYTHNIENEGEGDLVTLMWANEIFDPDHPDTYREEV